VAGVDEEVEEHLLHLSGVDVDAQRLVVELPAHRDLRVLELAGCYVEGGLDGCLDVAQLAARCLRASECHEVARDLGAALGGA